MKKSSHPENKQHGESVERTEEHDRLAVLGAEPCNTAPSNCTPFRYGIDSLYLSFQGELSEEGSIRLETARESARSELDREKAVAQISILDHQFTAGPSGGKLFRHRLSDHAYWIQIKSQHARNRPLAVGQIASHYLTGAGVESAANELRLILSSLGEVEPGASVTRLDLFVDFVSPFALDSWPDEAWVTRARFQDRHRVDSRFTGWSIGRGAIMARLYDKTIQIKTSGQNYLEDLWRAKGWDGVSPVYRLEFQFRNEILRQLDSHRYPEVLERLGGLWVYATQKWLRLTLPTSSDDTRARWEAHPLWVCLQAIPWNTLQPVERVHSLPSKCPSDARLYSSFVAALTSYMAVRKISDPIQATHLLLSESADHYDGRAEFTGEDFLLFAKGRASRKALDYRNPFQDSTDDASAGQDRAVEAARIAAADAYRKASGR